MKIVSPQWQRFCKYESNHSNNARILNILIMSPGSLLLLLLLLIIIWFVINVHVHRQHPHEAPFQVASWLAAGMADLTPDLQVCLSSSTLCDPSLSAASMSSWTAQAHAFHQPACHRLSWLYHWSVPRAHTSGTFSPSGWGLYPHCQAAQVTHGT